MDIDTAARDQLGAAIASAIETRWNGTQNEFAQRVSDEEGRTPPWSQPQVDAWRKGRSLTTGRVFAIERALELPPGTLAKIAGFAPLEGSTEIRTVEEAIAADTALSPPARRMLMALYDTAIEESTRARGGR